MYPLLSLSHITLTPDLVQRLPRRLAYYHLALPIAQDEDGVSVAMAYPDNRLVVQVLESILKAPVIPVRCSGEEIKIALDAYWQDNDDANTPGGLSWSDDPAFQTQVDGWVDVLAPLVRCAPAETSIVDCARQTQCRLIVAALTQPRNLAIVLSQSPAPLFLVRGEACSPKRILHVLRGHTPDRKVLDWVIPIAHQNAAHVTVLGASIPMLSRQGNPINTQFSTERVSEYGRILASVGVEGRLKIRQGTLESAILEELQAAHYDLVAIAAEAYGDFVYQVLQQIPDNPVSFLIVKP